MASILKVDKLQAPGTTTDALTIDSSGRVLQPNGIFVYAQLTTSNAQDSSHPYTTTNTDIRFDEVKVNRGSAYTESNGRFTAPVAGIYRMHANFLKNNTGTDTWFGIYKNGTDTLVRGYNGVADYAPVVCEAFFDLAANDYLTVRLQSGELNLNASNTGQYAHVLFELLG
jgi:hypothetical protein